MAYTNSSLIDYKKLSPNHSGKRTHSIDRISPHCVVGQLSVETIGNIFASSARSASCNYAIGKDGRIALIVEEKNRSWCTSSSANDQRAITIEIASDTKHPYTMNDKAYAKFIDLCVDICKRNGKKKLLWFNDKSKSLNYKPKSDEMVFTVHRWFKNKACPGDWLYSRLDDVAKEVTERLNKKSVITSPSTSTLNKVVKWNGCVNVTSLNVRTGAGTKYSKSSFSPLNKNIKVGVCDSVKASDGSTWYYIKYNDKYGFVNSKYIKKKETVIKYKVTANLNLRSIAGVINSKNVLCVVPKGKIVTYKNKHKTVDDVKWYYVTYGSKTGYVSGKYLKKCNY